jgi:sulfur carrier protein ThiS
MGHLVDIVEGLQRKYYNLEVEDGMTLRRVLCNIGLKQELVYVVLVNGERKPSDYYLMEGDRITVFSPPAGG